jgi:arylsulfatase
MASLLTGAHPRTTGIKLEHRRIPDTQLMLAEIFEAHGYRTGAVVANFNVGRNFGFAQGFDTFVESWQEAWSREAPDARFKNRAGRVKSYTNATIVTDQALHWLNESDSAAPYFLWLHYIDPHGPYVPPTTRSSLFENAYPPEPIEPDLIPDYQGQRDPETGELITDLGFYRAQYAREIRYLDDQIEQLLRGIETLALDRPEPIIVISADHGESLAEQGYYLEHGRFAYQSTAHVPLLIVHEGHIPAGLIFPDPVGLIDVSPTLLDLAGLSIPETFEGTSLVSLIETGDGSAAPEHVFMEAGYEQPTQLVIRAGRWKLIHVRSPEDREQMDGEEFELYDVRADPGERTNLAAENPALVNELHGALEGWYVAHGEAEESDLVDLRDLDESDQEMLRALGYLE